MKQEQTERNPHVTALLVALDTYLIGVSRELGQGRGGLTAHDVASAALEPFGAQAHESVLRLYGRGYFPPQFFTDMLRAYLNEQIELRRKEGLPARPYSGVLKLLGPFLDSGNELFSDSPFRNLMN